MLKRQTIAQKLAFSAMIAALYAALTYATSFSAFTAGQFRFSEALTVLPFFFPEAVLGLTVGCFLSNIISPMGILDLVFGPLATLLAAALTARCKYKPLAIIPPIVINAIVIGAVIAYSSAPDAFWEGFWPNALGVGIGQTTVLVLLGLPIIYILPKTALKKLF